MRSLGPRQHASFLVWGCTASDFPSWVGWIRTVHPWGGGPGLSGLAAGGGGGGCTPDAAGGRAEQKCPFTAWGTELPVKKWLPSMLAHVGYSRRQADPVALCFLGHGLDL